MLSHLCTAGVCTLTVSTDYHFCPLQTEHVNPNCMAPCVSALFVNILLHSITFLEGRLLFSSRLLLSSANLLQLKLVCELDEINLLLCLFVSRANTLAFLSFHFL